MELKRQRLPAPFAHISLGYVEWGRADSDHTIVCVHGLTRNARDFDTLAADLAAWGARVLAIDVVGRGRSDWLTDPRDYDAGSYAAQLALLLRVLCPGQVDWIGTSMGGMIGMLLAAGEDPPIRRLVLNDIGPFVPVAALQRIAGYVGRDQSFAAFGEVVAYLREVHVGFGPLTEPQWHALAEHGTRLEGTSYRLNYDPAIRQNFAETAQADIDVWQLYERISCKVLVLRGAQSDLLSAETAAAMAERGPRATVVTIDGVGHAPALMAPDQIATIRHWLMR